MGMALENKAKDDPGRSGDSRSTRDDVASARELLEQAQELAAQIEGLLTKLGQSGSDADTFRVRLARAHTLSLLDQLSELIGPRPSGYGPAVADRGPREDDENATSGVRQAPAWR